MIKVNYAGRLGNNLFQYAFARIIAEQKGYFLSAPEINGFDITKEVVDGKKLNIDMTLSNQIVDIDEILKYNCGIELKKAFLEQYSYYQPYKNIIREWYDIGPVPNDIRKKYNYNQNDVIVHFRLGDIYKKGRSLLFKDVDYLLSLLDFENVYICSDSFNNEHCMKLTNKYNAVFIRENELNTMRIIKSFNKIILGTSTFSWWPAWLSTADEIIMPWKIGSWWSNKGNKTTQSDLRVFDDPRYKIIEF